MANRYCNLVGSKKISEDFQNINVGFDKVQQDMDSKSSGNHRHPNATDTTDGFMSAQDKAKMDASTAAATPGTLVQRDASGRMKAAAPSAKTDVARKAEVDAVQSDLDSHKADAVMHVTEAAHEKLGSIEDGAEVNQPAFAKVNDIEASEKTDALTFKGGVGIKVTTNPITKEVTVTATGDSTPGAHGSSHTEHGSDPIPNATAKEGGLMSSSDKAEFDKIAPEVPKHSTQLKEHAAELEDHDQRIEDVESGLADVPGTPLELRPGLQVVETEQDAPFQMGEVKGRTLINLPGSEGNFDYRTSPLPVIFGTGEIISSSGPAGTKAQKVVCNRAADNPGHFAARYELDIDRSKHYIAVAYMDNVSCDAPVYFSIAEMKDTGYTSLRLSAKISKGSGMQYLYTTVSPAQMENREKLVYYFRGEGTGGNEFRVGPFAFYEITAAEYDVIAKMTPEQVAERYPYVDSMTNVKNPYAIVTGGNLLPPFYEWSPQGVVKVTSPYEAELTPTTNEVTALWCDIPTSPNTDYILSIDQNGATMSVTGGADGAIIVDNTAATSANFNSGDRNTIRVYVSNYSEESETPSIGNFTFKNPMLIVGTEPKPFTPQQRSILAFETELAAHPVDSSNPDTLYMGDDGIPYVLEKWKKVTLDGSYTWRVGGTKIAGAKLVATSASFAPMVGDEIGVKFNGKLLTIQKTGEFTDGDTVNVTPNNLYLSVYNSDSGWGPDYNPTQEEIKAYFLGWRMFLWGAGPATPFNGEGTRGWGKIYCGVGSEDNGAVAGSGTTSVPTTMNDMGYTPYRLQYLKAKPTVEPVRNYEMGATLSAGSNMVEVGSGIVIREKANPVVNYINAINAAGGRLKYRTTRLLAIYRNQARDFGWTFKDNIWNGEPYQYAEHPIPALANAVYHVTYTMLDPTIAAPISGTVGANLRGTVSDLVQDVGDVQRRLSVVETQKAEKDAQPPQRIKPTLLNGWEDYGASFERSFYYKDESNIVTVEGLIGKGTPALGTPLFILPEGFRPDRTLILPVLGWVSGVGDALVRIDVEPTGVVKIGSSNAKNDYLSLQGITFLAMK